MHASERAPARQRSPWMGSRPPCAKTVSLTTRTVGFLLSSMAMGPPGLYTARRTRAKSCQSGCRASRGKQEEHREECASCMSGCRTYRGGTANR
eukprot:929870-Pelagomonas_calceolata.AAC.5